MKSGVQHRRIFNGMIDKVSAHEGLGYLSMVYLHGQAIKPEHGFIFSTSEYNARLNVNQHDWYREAVADYVSYTPVFIGSKLKEPILSAELDRARPNPDAELGRAFLVTPDKFSPMLEANFAARNISIINGTLSDFVDWLKSNENSSKVTPIDVAVRVNAVARELSGRAEINTRDADATRTVSLRSWAITKRDADALEPKAKERLARAFLEGMSPTWTLAATDIPVWLSAADKLYGELEAKIRSRTRLFVVQGQSGSGKTTSLLQSMLRFLREYPETVMYECANDTPSLKAVLTLLSRLHRNEHVVVFLPDLFPFADTLLSDLTSFDEGRFTVVSTSRTGEWKDHIQRRVGSVAASFVLQRFDPDDYVPLIQRLIRYVPAPEFFKLDTAQQVQRMRDSKSQLLIALKETTGSVKFDDVITNEFETLPDDDSRALVLIVGLATIARTGVTQALAREAYSIMRTSRTFEQALRAASGIVSLSSDGRLHARHELYVRQIFDNVAKFRTIVDTVISILAVYTKYKRPIVKSVGKLDFILFKFLLNHQFNAQLAKRRGDMREGKNIYSTFEVSFQLDGHFWLQYGEYLVEDGDLNGALTALAKSIEAYSGNTYAVHAYADIQLRVAARRSTYDATTVRLIGEAVRALEEQHANHYIDSDQYPIVTLATKHIAALVQHDQTQEAKQCAKRYFAQLNDMSKTNSSSQVQHAREQLAHFITSGRWRRARPARKKQVK